RRVLFRSRSVGSRPPCQTSRYSVPPYSRSWHPVSTPAYTRPVSVRTGCPGGGLAVGIGGRGVSDGRGDGLPGSGDGLPGLEAGGGGEPGSRGPPAPSAHAPSATASRSVASGAAILRIPVRRGPAGRGSGRGRGLLVPGRPFGHADVVRVEHPAADRVEPQLAEVAVDQRVHRAQEI